MKWRKRWITWKGARHLRCAFTRGRRCAGRRESTSNVIGAACRTATIFAGDPRSHRLWTVPATMPGGRPIPYMSTT